MPAAARKAQPLIGRSADREGAEGGPGSQETCLRPQAHKPSWKGVAHAHISSYVCGVPDCAVLIVLVRVLGRGRSTKHGYGASRWSYRDDAAPANPNHNDHDAYRSRR